MRLLFRAGIRYIGKVTKFGLFRIIIFRSNCHFSVGEAENTPPPTGVGLKINDSIDGLKGLKDILDLVRPTHLLNL